MTYAPDSLKPLLHKVRSPLAAIYTAGQMMVEFADDTPLSKVQRQVRLINSSVEEARKILLEAEALIDEAGATMEEAEARVEEGQTTVHKAEVDRPGG
jgi:signal transduction histidine kinase